jgi:hypothetical protein
MFGTLKVAKEPKIRMGLPDGICGLDARSTKNIGTSNKPIKTKIFPKKSMFSTLKV